MARKAETKVKKKRRSSRFTTMLILVGIILMLIVANVVVDVLLRYSEGQGDEAGHLSLFSVKEVTVSGDTRYLPEAIIQQSGLAVGQSVWSVDKEKAAQNILDTFPYIAQAEVKKTAFDRLTIHVSETDEIGVMYGFGQWLAVGANGKVLQTTPLESDRPMRTLYFKQATAVSGKLGEQAMDDRCLAIVTELLAAFDKYGLDGVCEIDLGNKSDLRLNWKNRITIKLGNDSNLTHEIGVVMSALPGVEKQYGENAMGQLDVSAFSENGTMAVFTPQDLLDSTTTTTKPEETTDPETTVTENQ